MARWSQGSPVVERLLASRHLETVTGSAADGYGDLDAAETTLNTAAGLVRSDPRMALIAAYDAARLSLVGLLLQQGLRPTVAGGHICVGEAISAQFGVVFRDFDAMRRRRNELEYPQTPADRFCAAAEAEDAVARAREIHTNASALIGQLSFFS